MLFCGLFFFVGLAVFWLFGNFGWFSSSLVLGYSCLDLPFLFMVDDISIVCCYMLGCCGVIALFYCYHYFSSDPSGFILFLLMFVFILVMFVLMLSFSLVSLLVFWEYLGLVSFFLILFYSNSVSLRAAIITLFASRFGDVSLFILIFWLASLWDLSSCFSLVLLFFIILTKSAGYPFVSWLIEAMRAPTPVSSLVHSSTLVAAGVWFLLRFDWFFTPGFLSFLLLLCLVTVFVSGFCAATFVDLKKIVALSTCNNVSWCIVFFICGDVCLALLQLLCHGVSKCYLFISVGDVMSASSGSQASKAVYLSRYGSSFGGLVQLVLVFSLCGLPFLGVFFGKHGLMPGLLYSCNSFLVCVLFLCFFLSYIYSFRFYLLLLGESVGLSVGFFSSFVLVFGLSLLSTFLNYGGSFLFLEYSCLGSLSSIMFLMIQVFGLFVGGILWYYCFQSRGAIWSSSLGGSDFLVLLVYSWFLQASSSFLLGFYRWEAYLLSFFRSAGLKSVLHMRDYRLFSINFMLLGGAILFGSYVVIFC
nr:NADH dehydrogenase subunit 5 [Glypthelmins quieta]